MKSNKSAKRKRAGTPPPPIAPAPAPIFQGGNTEPPNEPAPTAPEKKGYTYYCPTCGTKQNLEDDFLISLSSIFENGQSNLDLIFLLMNSNIEIDSDYFLNNTTDPEFEALSNHYKYLAEKNSSNSSQTSQFGNSFNSSSSFGDNNNIAASSFNDPFGAPPTSFEDETASPFAAAAPEQSDSVFMNNEVQQFSFDAGTPEQQPEAPFGNVESPFGTPESPFASSESPFASSESPFASAESPFGTSTDTPLGDSGNPFGQSFSDSNPLVDQNGLGNVDNVLGDQTNQDQHLDDHFRSIIDDLNKNEPLRHKFDASGIVFDYNDPDKLVYCEKLVWILSFLRLFDGYMVTIDEFGVLIPNPYITRLLSSGKMPFQNNKFKIDVTFDFKTIFTVKNINEIFKRIENLRLDAFKSREYAINVTILLNTVKSFIVKFDASTLNIAQYPEPKYKELYPEFPGDASFSTKKVSKRICKHCCSAIPYYSGLMKQAIFSFIGMPASGKSTIINAIYSKLKDNTSIYTQILYTKISEQDENMGQFKAAAEKAVGGLTVDKTDLNENPSLSVMIAKRKGENEIEDEILFTFVDIPGEIFMPKETANNENTASNGIDFKANETNNYKYFERFRIMANSDMLYIVIASEQLSKEANIAIQDDNNGMKTAMASSDFIDFYKACDFFRLNYLANAENSQSTVPVSFILSKVDAIEPKKNPGGVLGADDGTPNYKRENYYIHKDALGHISYIWKTHTSSLQKNKKNMKKFMEITTVAEMFEALKRDPQYILWHQPNPALDLPINDPKNGYIDAGKLIDMQSTAHEVSDYVCAEYEESIKSLFHIFDPGHIDFSDLPFFPISPFGFYGVKDFWEVENRTKQRGLKSSFSQLNDRQMEILVELCSNSNKFESACQSNISSKDDADALRLLVNCSKENITMTKDRIFELQYKNVINLSNRFVLAFAKKLLKNETDLYDQSEDETDETSNDIANAWYYELQDVDAIADYNLSHADIVINALNDNINSEEPQILKITQILQQAGSIVVSKQTGRTLFENLVSESILSTLEDEQQKALLMFFKIFFKDSMKNTSFTENDYIKMARLMTVYCIKNKISELENMYEYVRKFSDEQLDLIRNFDKYGITKENVLDSIKAQYIADNQNNMPFGLDYLIFWIMILSGHLDYLCLDCYAKEEQPDFIRANRKQERRENFRHPRFTTANCDEIHSIAEEIKKMEKNVDTAINERNNCRSLQRKLFYFNRPYKQLRYYIKYSENEINKLKEKRQKLIESNPCF